MRSRYPKPELMRQNIEALTPGERDQYRVALERITGKCETAFAEYTLAIVLAILNDIDAIAKRQVQ